MKRNLLTILTLLLPLCWISAQNVRDLVISEAQTEGVSMDDGFGNKAPWFELFNNSWGSVNYAGCFLSNDRNHLKKYLIPKSDNSTVLAPRQSVVFFADGNSLKGTCHTSFTLESGQTLYLVSNDGRTVVDSLLVPAGLTPGKSIAKFAIDNKALNWTDIHESDPTPGSYQQVPVFDEEGNPTEETKSEKIAKIDPHGLTLTLVSVSVVFISLAILYLCYALVGAICTGKFKKTAKPKKGKSPDAECAAAIALALSMEQEDGAVQAAIALALELERGGGVHDEESYIITIKRK